MNLYILTNKWFTEVKCADGYTYRGPMAEGKTFEEAEQGLQDNGMGYAHVVGKAMFELSYFELN